MIGSDHASLTSRRNDDVSLAAYRYEVARARVRESCRRIHTTTTEEQDLRQTNQRRATYNDCPLTTCGNAVRIDKPHHS